MKEDERQCNNYFRENLQMQYLIYMQIFLLLENENKNLSAFVFMLLNFVLNSRAIEIQIFQIFGIR